MIEEIFGNGYRSLFLVSFWEPRDNDLAVVVLEAKPQGPEVDALGLGLEGQEILPDPKSMAIEVQWKDCIVYAVSNESYSVAEPGREPPKRMLEERTDSAFLNYVFASTWARNEYPGPIQHWVLFCENHVLDVACLKPPMVSRVPVLPEWLARDRPRVFHR
jgi:hypothetical protein